MTASPPVRASVRTLADLVFHVAELSAGRADLLSIRRQGRTEAWSTERFVAAIHATALALEARGLRKGDRAALFAENCPEWFVADLACQLLGVISVPIYSTLPVAQVAAILRDSGARWVFFSDAAKHKLLLDTQASLTEPLGLVTLEPGASMLGTALEALLAQGEGLKSATPLEALRGRVTEDDVASLIYTSGTTGEPKGVMLTHKNFVSNMLAGAEVFPMGPDDLAMSFLPLSHVFERTCDHIFFFRGVPVHYVPAIERVPPALPEIRPTVLPSVPRLYERAYLKVLANVQKDKAWKRRLFFWAVEVGKRHAAARERGAFVGPWLRLRHAVAQRLVYAKLQERFGGRLRLPISGGAPLPREIGAFFSALGVPLYQGYGLTETAPVLTVNHPRAQRQGSVGRPLPGVEIRIAPDGEILAKSPGVMRGYWQKPEATAEVFDTEGWFHTGDIGYLDGDGFLFITDRKKDILVTSGGKNVAPQPIEKALLESGLFAQVVVVGDGYPQITALLVPNVETLGAELGVHDQAALARDPRAEERIQKALDQVNSSLAEHERVRRFRLLERELSIADGELTPTLKVKRKVVLEKYRAVIASMYLKTQRVEG
jgi:long-chain acyl-CoA synthetase